MPSDRNESDELEARMSRKTGNPLQRGSACLSCRKRKMKCDATKPVCRQCVKANRADECDYDDGRQKSRTQILQEKIAKLEDRIRELETSGGDASELYNEAFGEGSSFDGSPDSFGGGFTSVTEGIEVHGMGMHMGGGYGVDGTFPTHQSYSQSPPAMAAPGSGPTDFSPLALGVSSSLPSSLPPSLSSSALSSSSSLSQAYAQPHMPYPAPFTNSPEIFASPGSLFFGLPASPGSGSSHSNDGHVSSASSSSGHAHRAHSHGGSWSQQPQPQPQASGSGGFGSMFAAATQGTNSLTGAAFALPDPILGAVHGYNAGWNAGQGHAPATGNVWEADQLPLKDRKMLLDIFLPHAKQCGFDVHIGRLHQRLGIAPIAHSPHLAQSSQTAHPCLSNAIYLLACHFSSTTLRTESPPLDLTAREPHFLTLTLRGIAAALEEGENAESEDAPIYGSANHAVGARILVDAVQASALLAVYFFGKARLLEGYYHASAAARLAIALGMHQIRNPVWREMSPNRGSPHAEDGIASGSSLAGSLDAASAMAGSWSGSPAPSVPLPAPKDAIELGERVNAFWSVFCVDRCWSVATGLPSSLPDDEHPQLQICTIWPWELGSEITRANADYSSVDSLYDPLQPVASATSSRCTKAYKSKASVFFERGARIASLQSDPSQWEQVAQMDFALARFNATLPTFIDPMSSVIDPELAVVHTLAHVSVIQLHHPFVQKEPASHAKCLQAARAVTEIIRRIGDAEFQLLDPIIGTCWMCVSDVFIRERVWNKETLGLAASCYRIDDELDIVIAALKALSFTFPVAIYQAQKVEESRNISF